MPTPSLYLATPCYGGEVSLIYTQSLLALQPACEERGVALRIDMGGGDALISRARAGMLARFVASGGSHLLFADADIGFTPQDVFRLLATGRDVVGGSYPRKALDVAALRRGAPLPAAVSREAADFAGADSAGLERVDYCGTAFLMISQAAARRMIDGYPQLRARLGDVAGAIIAEAVMVFDSFVDPATGRYLPDYEAFCRRWRDLGGEVWVDPQVRVSHLAEAALSL